MTINPDSPFWVDLEKGKTIMYNGGPIPTCYWNLVSIKGQLLLYSAGMKPHKHWKISDVKNYLGFKGSNDELFKLVNKLIDEFKEAVQ